MLSFASSWVFLVVMAVMPVWGMSLSNAEQSVPTPAQHGDRNSVRVGDEAPNFHLRDLQGRTMSLSQFRGKVVLLNFWATWCGPCRIEMPAMERLSRTVSRKDFEILAVSTDPQGAAVTRPFQQDMGLTFPILHDPDMRTGLTYGTRTLPLSFMVDRQGVVRKKIFGARDWDSPEARELIRMLTKS